MRRARLHGTSRTAARSRRHRCAIAMARRATGAAGRGNRGRAAGRAATAVRRPEHAGAHAVKRGSMRAVLALLATGVLLVALVGWSLQRLPRQPQRARRNGELAGSGGRADPGAELVCAIVDFAIRGERGKLGHPADRRPAGQRRLEPRCSAGADERGRRRQHAALERTRLRAMAAYLKALPQTPADPSPREPPRRRAARCSTARARSSMRSIAPSATASRARASPTSTRRSPTAAQSRCARRRTWCIS